MDYPDVRDIATKHGDMEISAMAKWPWKKESFPWVAPLMSSILS